MPQLLSPKFADMVRVTSTTQGTGPLVCGPAVPGFATFAESVSVGDSFYYCIQGTEKPQEREVGQGTLLGNGTISRVPLGGGLTNFSPGAKTIALVAASEWYESVQESCARAERGSAVLDRAELKRRAPSVGSCCFLAEAGREGLFAWDVTVPVALHQADTLEGIFVAPDAAAAGAWVRRYEGDAWLHWWGAKADYNVSTQTGTDNRPMFLAALATMLALTGVGEVPFLKASAKLRVRSGLYRMSQQVDIRQTIIVEGDGVGLAAPRVCEFFFPRTGCGFIVQRENTSGGSGSGTTLSQGAGDGAIFRGIAVNFTGTPPASPADDAEFHGFLFRARGAVEDCQVSNARGDGVKVEGDSPGENANGVEVRRFKAYNCRNGVKIVGGDANVVRTEHVDGIFVRRFTIWDESFLGCYHGSPQALANGIVYPGYGVNYLGKSYTPMLGQEEAARTNPPSGGSADNAFWSHIADGTQSAWATWASGMARVETSGAFYMSGAGGNGPSVLDFAYAEDSQGPTICNAPAEIRGGVAAKRVRGTGLVTQSTGGAHGVSSLRVNGSPVGAGYGAVTYSGSSLRLLNSPDGVAVFTDQVLVDAQGQSWMKGSFTARGPDGKLILESQSSGDSWFVENNGGSLQFRQPGQAARFNLNAAGKLAVSSVEIGGSLVKGMITLTQTAYDALATKDPDTFYFITA